MITKSGRHVHLWYKGCNMILYRTWMRDMAKIAKVALKCPEFGETLG